MIFPVLPHTADDTHLYHKTWFHPAPLQNQGVFLFCRLFFYSFVPTSVFVLAFLRWHVLECFEIGLWVKLNITIIISFIFSELLWYLSVCSWHHQMSPSRQRRGTNRRAGGWSVCHYRPRLWAISQSHPISLLLHSAARVKVCTTHET